MKRLFLTITWLALFATGSTASAEGGYRPSGSTASENTYIFAPHPYLNPQELYSAYEPIVRYLEAKIPGVHFRVETSKNYAAYEGKIAAGSFHFGLPNPYQTVFSLKHGYSIIAKMTPDENFRGLMVVRKDSKINQPHDLVGKTLCFPSPTAVATTMLPLLYLQEHGLNIKQNTIKYVGSPYSAILNVYSGDASACGSSVRHWRNWSQDNPDKVEQLKTIWLTDALPHNGVIARADVPPKLAQQVASVLVGMDKDKNLDQSQFKSEQAHFEPAGNDTYLPMATFLKRYDELIGLPPQMKSY